MTLPDVKAALKTLGTMRTELRAVFFDPAGNTRIPSSVQHMGEIEHCVWRATETDLWLNQAILFLTRQEQAMIVAQNKAQEPPRDTEQALPSPQGQWNPSWAKMKGK